MFSADFFSNWETLGHIFENPKFIWALNLRRWWSKNPEIGNNEPILYMDCHNNPNALNIIQPDELKYITKKLNKCNMYSPYWYCYPTDCVDLNSIVTGTLVSLTLNLPMKELYCISIIPNDTYDPHVVITPNKCLVGDVLHFPKFGSNITHTEKNNVILFDLIYPLSPFYGKSWADRNINLITANVVRSSDLESYWADMGYIQYPLT